MSSCDRQFSPAPKGQKRAGGRSRVCPNFYCSLLFTRMCTLNLCIIQTYCFTGTTCHRNILRNYSKSLDILNFYLLVLFRRTKDLGHFPYQSAYRINLSLVGGVTTCIRTLHCCVMFSLIEHLGFNPEPSG